MSIYFCNKSIIDLDAIKLMGVSVKEEGAIGYFGTGLKFAIATLLREGHSIKLTVDGAEHTISCTTKLIRGENFDVVCIDGEQTGFTTKMGRNWRNWQAYRELHSNCLDEDGVISDKLPEGDWGTIIEVAGVGIEESFHNRHVIFVQTNPIFYNEYCEIHPTQSTYGYYRGVQVATFGQPSLYTYNVTDKTELTEDRTLKGETSFRWSIASAIIQLDDEDMLAEILLSGRDTFEGKLDLDVTHRGEPSQAFMNVVARHKTNMELNRTAFKVWKSRAGVGAIYENSSVNSFQEAEISKALDLLKKLDVPMARDDFLVVESLGGSVYGVVTEGQIIIDRKTLDKGVRFIASTLYEEWLHKECGLDDESRELQNTLFERLFSMVERVNHLEAA